MNTEKKKTNLSIPLKDINIAALPMFLILIIVQIASFVLFNGTGQFFAGQSTSSWIILGSSFILGIVLHEFLHGLGFAYASGNNLSVVKYGFDAKTLTPYAHCKVPIKAGPYRIGAALPGVLMGVIPWIVSVILNDAMLFYFSVFFLTAASGDMLILLIIKDVDKNDLVEDHPSAAGCYVYGSKEYEVPKFFKYLEFGKRWRKGIKYVILGGAVLIGFIIGIVFAKNIIEYLFN